MAKAVVFFAEGTEECEALLVVDLLRRAKVEVLVASASGSREILSSHKVHITADALAEEVDYSDVDLVVLPGGIPGTPNLAANKTVTDTCVAFAKAGKKVAAICAAPSVLAALARSHPHISVDVRIGNTPARNLYESLGFVQDGLRKGYYDLPKEDAVLMSRTDESVPKR